MGLGIRRDRIGPNPKSRTPNPESVAINIPVLLDRLCYRYPSLLVDVITEHEAGRRLVAVKNLTVSEDFFQGHFPGMRGKIGRAHV